MIKNIPFHIGAFLPHWPSNSPLHLHFLAIRWLRGIVGAQSNRRCSKAPLARHFSNFGIPRVSWFPSVGASPRERPLTEPRSLRCFETDDVICVLLAGLQCSCSRCTVLHSSYKDARMPNLGTSWVASHYLCKSAICTNIPRCEDGSRPTQDGLGRRFSRVAIPVSPNSGRPARFKREW